LQARWYPNVKDADIDRGDENRSGNHDRPRSSAIRYNDTDTVDDDLQQKLNLNTPKEENGKVKNKACTVLGLTQLDVEQYTTY
jgi:hypothetical protein